MKTILNILTVSTLASTSIGSSVMILNTTGNNTCKQLKNTDVIDGRNYIGDKIYDIKFYNYINNNTFLKIKDIYLQNLPFKAIEQINDLFKNFYKEKDLPFMEVDYEKLSTVIYNNFSKIYMVNKQGIRGIKIEIGYNQADFLVTNVINQ